MQEKHKEFLKWANESGWMRRYKAAMARKAKRGNQSDDSSSDKSNKKNKKQKMAVNKFNRKRV